ncbi:2-oxo-4-hydroxy-4-carboxy-5-ureidoimidazoline decarboxylase [Kibdelosporangium persicum]|uniref:2-oxo-4-hydroxy-4-carboxy-5-ureidoimidazoline decarboxylase n=1 Tax=Kibdelosporangium persicum TaxID=2698649 RepID=A0ABX2FEL5_9PSEU|nr:2-oxo-4-hydroxy-4-carboxy-5-ureidoimidazoline decarboxylase [Kibdelosporangium persicum]NRN69320.1 Uric acid degradation bifunctional protein PucL [Kibdelosporangium persicum]
MPAVNLHRFNSAPADDLRPLLRDCLAVPRWADEVLALRPFADRATLLSVAFSRARELSNDELHLAMAAHPRIGERQDGDAWSQAEQSGVDQSLGSRLQVANQRYEERFGHIYLVYASGRTGEELLEILEQRLGNSPADELRIVNEELAKIALRRLEQLVTDV